MVYISSLNAFLGVGLILVLSSFILYVGHLWIVHIEDNAERVLYEELEGHVCNCLSIISDNNIELVIMNVNCLYVENLTIIIGPEIHMINQTLYYEDYITVHYDYQPLFYSFYYNNCTEIFNK